LAAVRAAEAEPLPYLLICAFIANAASFVQPISNPANLVVKGRDMAAVALTGKAKFTLWGIGVLAAALGPFTMLHAACPACSRWWPVYSSLLRG
jgi:Na+/H+ antiporter NhaD/arsenite permease-like protein